MLSTPISGTELPEKYSLENVEFFKTTTLTNINSNQLEYKNLSERKESISNELLSLGEVKKLLIQLKNSKMFEKKDFILNTINTALNDVFNDQNIKIDLVASNTNQEASKLNIKYDIVLYQNGVELSRNEKMVEQNGGGIISFISILFKILVGFIYSRNRFYVFDESLSEVSEIYLPRMGQFFQKFCKIHKFTIILITHTKVISEYSDITYHLDGDFENGVPTLKIEKIDGEYPEENYIYSKIENFQSIKKLEFRYKGFTTIVGKNNIGKSASFRAINSLLFNTFDIKLYPRFESSENPNKLLNTKLEFGFFSKKDSPENEDKKIGFYKKGQSIIWQFNGMEFVGKNLAFDKVKEKIESIGFKYLKLKEQYKNFKGNLKDQTERLAITTQQDGYYLIAGKTSDTSKVFDFLFDSREVTLALVDLNNDIKSKENELNLIVGTMGQLEFNTSRLNLELKYWDTLFKITIINKLKETSTILDFNKNELELQNTEIMLYNKILNISDLIWRMEYTNSAQMCLTKEKENCQIKIQILTNLIHNLEKIDLINNIKESIQKNLYQKELIENRIKSLNIINIQEILFVSNFVSNLKSQFEKARTKLIILDKLITNLFNRVVLENYIGTFDIIAEKKKFVEKLQSKLNILLTLLTKYGQIRDIKITLDEFISQNSFIQKINSTINYNKICLEYYTKSIQGCTIKSILFEYSEEDKRNQLRRSQIDNLKQSILELPKVYGLTPCKQCETLGFIQEGHQC